MNNILYLASIMLSTHHSSESPQSRETLGQAPKQKPRYQEESPLLEHPVQTNWLYSPSPHGQEQRQDSLIGARKISWYFSEFINVGERHQGFCKSYLWLVRGENIHPVSSTAIWRPKKVGVVKFWPPRFFSAVLIFEREYWSRGSNVLLNRTITAQIYRYWYRAAKAAAS